MRILFFRHGIAEEARPDLPDENRQLTGDGFNRTRMAVAGLRQIVGKVDVILTSPKVRASQTASILGESVKGLVTPLDLLAHGSVDDVIKHLAHRSEDAVAIIGHNPQMNLLASRLCTISHTQPFFKIKKAGAVMLNTPDVLHIPAKIVWALGPGQLSSLVRPPRVAPEEASEIADGCPAVEPAADGGQSVRPQADDAQDAV